MPQIRAAWPAALVGVLGAALLTACTGAAPSPRPRAAPPSTTPAATYLPCVISDTGGLNDGAANQLALKGVLEAAKDTGGTYKAVQPLQTTDYPADIAQLLGAGCDMVVASGIGLASAVSAVAAAHPRTDFLVVDDGPVTAPNVTSVAFDCAEAAFLGGYAAAAYSTTGVVATYGGYQYPSITACMDGVAEGVAYYNQRKGTRVQLLGWDEQRQQGEFLGSLSSQDGSEVEARSLIRRGADVIVPVVGPLYRGAAAAVRASGTSAVLVGVGSDLQQTDTDGDNGLFLTSVLLDVDPVVRDAVMAAARGPVLEGRPYVGDLRNGGVGLAPFHSYADRVPPGLGLELTAIRAGIADGTIPVRSPARPRP